MWNPKKVLFMAVCLLVIHVYLFLPENATPLWAQEEFSMDIYVNADGVKGSSMDKGHEGWIEAAAVGFSMTTPVESGGGVIGRPTFDGLTVVKHIDISSPILSYWAVTGRHLKSVKIDFVGHSTTDWIFYQIRMTDVLISSVSVNTNSIDLSLKETYKLYPAKVIWTVTPLLSNGSTGTPIERSWEIPRLN